MFIVFNHVIFSYNIAAKKHYMQYMKPAQKLITTSKKP